MVDIQALDRALSKIDDVRKDELFFDIEDTKVGIRVLLPDEEIEVQKYAALAWEESGDDTEVAAYQDFLGRIRKDTIARAIVYIDNLDLREVEYLSDGENERPKHEVVRELLEKRWSRPMILQVYEKFIELMTRVELRSENKVKFDPTSLREEIVRTRARLKSLEEKLENSESSNDQIQKSQKQAFEVGKRQEEIRSKVIREEPRVTKQEPKVPPRQPPQQQQPPQQNGVTVPYQGDSMFDPADPQAAMAAENERQRQLYQKAQKRAPTPPRGPAKAPAPRPRNAVQPSNLRNALNTANHVFDQVPSNQLRRGAPPIKKPESVDIYRMPTQKLDRPIKEGIPNGSPLLNPTSTSLNPRFRPKKA